MGLTEREPYGGATALPVLDPHNDVFEAAAPLLGRAAHDDHRAVGARAGTAPRSRARGETAPRPPTAAAT
ncbi:hypothetical protein, partial [Streptomyces sp. NPDC001657]|uniref:hypothetical protein n=1 Tax=Streptomyces sp. NPDC001657 TaxID=3154522 RepID=UPI003330BC8E